MDALAAPAWIVALATAAFFGAKAVLAVRSPNGNGRGVFEGRVVTLLENQTRELVELRKIAADTKGILETQVELLRAHDQRAVAAIARMDSRP